jgi:hypothetical protein
MHALVAETGTGRSRLAAAVALAGSVLLLAGLLAVETTGSL